MHVYTKIRSQLSSGNDENVSWAEFSETAWTFKGRWLIRGVGLLQDSVQCFCVDGMGGDLRGTGNGPPQNLRWETAHASVPPIFGEVVLWDALESTKCLQNVR